MKTQKFTIIVFFILFGVFAVKSAIIKNDERKNAPVLQHIEKAHISVSAAPFKEENIEGNGETSFKGFSFSSEYKKIQYCLTYAQYDKNPDVYSALAALEEIFKDYNFSYEPLEFEINANPALKIEGSYEKNGRKYGVKEVLIKKDKSLWQILTIYPFSEKNEKAAEEYINSAVLDEI
jgi:hypothetical protein